MATFKVGDRVRVIGSSWPDGNKYIGQETTITGSRFYHLPSGRYGYRTAITDPVWPGFAGVWEGHLAPLTPPEADFWASDKVKKLTKLDPDFIREESKRELREVIREQRG